MDSDPFQIRKRIWSSVSSDHRHSTKNATSTSACSVFWWGMVDSDHRSQWQQIYSLPPLAAREIPHMELVIGVEPTTCWLQISCSAIEPHQRLAFRIGRVILYHTFARLSIGFWKNYYKFYFRFFHIFCTFPTRGFGSNFDLSTLFWKKLQKNFSL